MENNENELNNDNLKDYQRKDIQDTIDQANFENKTKKELQSEERFKNYFSGFNPVSVEQFISSYASQKSLWHRFGDFYIEQNEAEELQWIEAAVEHLAMIQQKKLFDAQCLWRAEKVTFPEVQICFDFQVWERDVLSCPFIEPITEADIELYQQYLQQNNMDLETDRWMESWQDYEQIKEAYNNEDSDFNFPEWYDFHNGRTGASSYLLLPDIRGEKENFYDDLSRIEERPKIEAQQAEYDKTRDKRPHLRSVYDADFMTWFVSTFEDQDTQAYYKAYLQQSKNRDSSEQLMRDVELLSSAGELVPIEAHHDWREAIANAVARFRVKKIAEFLPAAYEQYALNQSMGILPSNEKARNDYGHIRELWANRILRGRELQGEPRDFNF